MMKAKGSGFGARNITRSSGTLTGTGRGEPVSLPGERSLRSALTSEHRDAWQSFLEDIERASAELKSRKTEFCEIWYRGHPQQSYSLLPALFRGYPHLNAEDTWDHIWQQEQDLYWEFASRARELHGVIEEDWDILFAMQHYGVPTRLLDWTETLAVGVYFALHRFDNAAGAPAVIDPQDPPCIWLLNPYELNVRNWSGWKARDLFDPKNLGWDALKETYYGYSDLLLEGGMDWDYPMAVYPRQRTTRMQVQRGWFTIHGDEFVRMDTLKHHERFLRRVNVPIQAELAAREYLKSAGTELFTLFPDLPNLAAHLSRQCTSARNEFVDGRGQRHKSSSGKRRSYQATRGAPKRR